eukprot:g46446.t1
MHQHAASSFARASSPLHVLERACNDQGEVPRLCRVWCLHVLERACNDQASSRMLSAPYVPLPDGAAPSSLGAAPVRTALSVGALFLLGWAAVTRLRAAPKPALAAAASTHEQEPWPAFVPRTGIQQVLLRPAAPGPAQLLAWHSHTSSALFLTSGASDITLQLGQGAVVQEAWLYGATQGADSVLGPLAPTGHTGDVVKGRLLRWDTVVNLKQALQHSDARYETMRSSQGAEQVQLERRVVCAVLRDGSTQEAYAYVTAAAAGAAVAGGAEAAVEVPTSVEQLLRLGRAAQDATGQPPWGSPTAGVSMDEQWLVWLDSPPPLARRLAAVLAARAQRLASAWLSREEQLEQKGVAARRFFPRDVDMVVSGSGFKALYYLGVMQVLESLVARGRLTFHRFAGGSSGAQTPCQILMTNLTNTVEVHLAYGLLCQRYTPGQNFARGGLNTERNWKQLTDWLFTRHKGRLRELDGRMFLSVSVLRWNGPQHVQHSQYSGQEELSRQAFYATGTVLAKYGPHWATDGGVSQFIPLFPTKDAPRSQMVVQPLLSKQVPLSMVFHYNIEQALRAMWQGQDDIAAFLDRFLSPTHQQAQHDSFYGTRKETIWIVLPEPS